METAQETVALGTTSATERPVAIQHQPEAATAKSCRQGPVADASSASAVGRPAAQTHHQRATATVRQCAPQQNQKMTVKERLKVFEPEERNREQKRKLEDETSNMKKKLKMFKSVATATTVASRAKGLQPKPGLNSNSNRQ